MLKAIAERFGRGTAAAALVSVLNVGSKALGFVREILLAWAFGTSAYVDALRLGLTYTTYLAHLFFGEAMTGVLVPLLARLGGAETHETQAIQLKAAVTMAAITITVPIGLVFIIVPQLVVDLLAPDLGMASRSETVAFLRVFGAAMPFYALTAIAVMERQAASDFVPLGLRPAGQNLFLIGGIVVAYVWEKPLVIPSTFLVYYALLFTVLDRGVLISSLRIGIRVAVTGLKTVVGRWLPLMSGLMLWRSNVLVERYFASRLPEGAIASVDYGRTITDLPLLLLAVPAGAILLTNLSRSRMNRLSASQWRKLGYLMLLVVGWSFAVVLLAEPLTSLIFQRGAFNAESVRATSAAVRGLGVGAWALAFGHVLTQVLMATAPPRSVILPAGISVLTNVGLAVMLVPALGLLGLTLASSGAAVTYAAGAAITIWLQSRTPT